MAEYRLTATDAAVIRTADEATIPNAPGNRDWDEYQDWLDAGGVPDPYVVPPPLQPEWVSTLGIKLACQEINYWDDFQAALGKLPDAEENFKLAFQIRRSDIDALGLSP